MMTDKFDFRIIISCLLYVYVIVLYLYTFQWLNLWFSLSS